MDLLQQYKAFISKHQLFHPTNRLLLAVSGGLDSVVLCYLCHQASYTFSIAHCNFGLRGTESERDEGFVKSLASQFNVPFFLEKFQTKQWAQESGLSIQEAARDIRYKWFQKILSGNVLPQTSSDADASTVQHQYLLTAHHADDSIETLLMNFFKGTGISGLHGIRPKSGNIIRPLLFAYRNDIEKYALSNGLNWVEDSSNSEEKYTRNYFRHTLVPQIEKVFPEVKSNLKNNVERFSEVEVLYHQAIALHKKRLLEHRGTEVYIPVLKLQKSQPLTTIIFEVIKEYNFSSRQVEEVMKLMESSSGKYITSSTHRILRNRAWLIISPSSIAEQKIILINKDDEAISFNNKTLLKKFVPAEKVQLSTRSDVAMLDAKDISFPLLLRKWRTCDYFYPLGLGKKKRLSRFLIDQKLSLIEKESVWVIESAKRIIWVVGMRIDDRFKITPSTKNLLQLSITNGFE